MTDNIKLPPMPHAGHPIIEEDVGSRAYGKHDMRNESMAMRRIIRTNRLLIEQGHKGDTIGALNEMADLRRDAERYRLLRRGQHWSVINGNGDTLRGDELDADVDERLAMHTNHQQRISDD